VRSIVLVTAITIRDAAHHNEVFSLILSSPEMDGWQAPLPDEMRQAFYHDFDPADADYWVSQLILNSAVLNQMWRGFTLVTRTFRFAISFVATIG
jgi:hypothetical protein